MTKKEIRKAVKMRLLAMTDEVRAKKSEKICAELANSESFISARSIFVYLSDKLEVQTQNIIKKAEKLGKKIYVPYVHGADMDAVLVTKPLADTTFVANIWGILEPIDTSVIAKMEDIDLIIVPAVALTKKGERLGHGKGYYDRFFEHCNAYKIGICYSEQLETVLPTEAHDVLLDEIITD